LDFQGRAFRPRPRRAASCALFLARTHAICRPIVGFRYGLLKNQSVCRVEVDLLARLDVPAFFLIERMKTCACAGLGRRFSFSAVRLERRGLLLGRGGRFLRTEAVDVGSSGVQFLFSSNRYCSRSRRLFLSSLESSRRGQIRRSMIFLCLLDRLGWTKRPKSGCGKRPNSRSGFFEGKIAGHPWDELDWASRSGHGGIACEPLSSRATIRRQ